MAFPKRYEPQTVEPEIRRMWQELGTYRYDPDSAKPCFSVDTPPPYVSAARLHVGHAMSSAPRRWRRPRQYRSSSPSATSYTASLA